MKITNDKINENNSVEIPQTSIFSDVYVTLILVAINVLLFVIMIVSGVDFILPEANDLIRWGANYNPLTTGGDWWRLLSSSYIHIGVFHILINMYMLWSIGKIVERHTGSFAFLVLYVSTGVIGSSVSLIFNPDQISAGASGAVFGIFGYLCFVLRSNASAIDFGQNFRQIIIVLVLNLIIGLFHDGIDLAAHVGGFVTGVISGLFIAGKRDSKFSGKQRERIVIFAVLTIASTLGVVISTSRPPLDFNIFEYEREFIDGKYSILYDKNVSKNDAGRLGKYLLKIGYLTGPTAEIHMSRRSGRYLISVVFRDDLEKKEISDASLYLSRLGSSISSDLFENIPTDVRILNTKYVTKKFIQYVNPLYRIDSVWEGR